MRRSPLCCCCGCAHRRELSCPVAAGRCWDNCCVPCRRSCHTSQRVHHSNTKQRTLLSARRQRSQAAAQRHVQLSYVAAAARNAKHSKLSRQYSLSCVHEQYLQAGRLTSAAYGVVTSGIHVWAESVVVSRVARAGCRSSSSAPPTPGMPTSDGEHQPKRFASPNDTEGTAAQPNQMLSTRAVVVLITVKSVVAR